MTRHGYTCPRGAGGHTFTFPSPNAPLYRRLPPQPNSPHSLVCSGGRRLIFAMTIMMGLLFLILLLRGCLSDFPPLWWPAEENKAPTTTTAASRTGSSSSILLPVSGNVYPLGYYSVSLNIGWPPKAFDLDIDTGSDLTWVQCDVSCVGCTKPCDRLYKPGNNLVSCDDPLCKALHTTRYHPCKKATDQCDYEVEYADQGSSLGVLVNDIFPLRLSNGSTLIPRLAFGCGYNQHYTGPISPPSMAGVLGLGNGKASILSQLSGLGVIRNVLGHCLSSRGGGFLFLGDDLVSLSKTAWTPMLSASSALRYLSGPADLIYDGKPTGMKGLRVIFDSGSSYTYLNAEAYKAVLSQLRADLKGKPLKEATEDNSLPLCWKGAKPFVSLTEVRSHFKTIVLSFTKSNAQLQLLPDAYLIISKHGNACSGILNGAEAYLGDMNVLGDISLLDKVVIYDNEKKQIGWAPANCHRLPKS